METTTLNVAETRRRTPTVVSVRLGGMGRPAFKAGQFFRVSLAGGKESRYLSAASSPARPYVEFTKRLTGSDFSRSFGALVPGDPVALEGPRGAFTVSGSEEKLLFLAGGIGITPILGILDDLSMSGSRADVALCFANRSPEETIYREELDGFARRLSLRVFYFCSAEAPGYCPGRINLGWITRLAPDFKERVTFLAGPPAMVSGVRDELLPVLGKERLRVEQLAGHEQGA